MLGGNVMVLTRRDLLNGTAASAALLVSAGNLNAANCAMPTKERQDSFTPQGVIDELMAGNERFKTGQMVNCNLNQQVTYTANGQFPIAAVVGCIDSRVPPEMVFDQNIGDIFSARIAGNFVNTDILGSLEFACRVAGAKAIVVLGHTECGAIKGAIDQAKLGNLTAMLERLEPAVQAAAPFAERTSSDQNLVQRVTDANVSLTVKQIQSQSSVLKEMVQAGELIIVGAIHDVATGSISLL
jgi:carbonic anhydrase